MRNIYFLFRSIVLIFVLSLVLPLNSFAQTVFNCGDTFSNGTTAGSSSYTFPAPPSGHRIVLVTNGNWTIPTGGTLTINGVNYTRSSVNPGIIYGDVGSSMTASVTFGNYTYNFSFAVKIGQAYTTAGPATFTAPDWVTSVNVYAWGGGGGGAGDNYGGSYGNGGGGGGAYAQINSFGVTPGNAYAVTVGAGGAAGNFNNGPGGDGGTSSFNSSTCVALGGQGGKAATVTNQGGAGGAGGSGTGSTGDVKWSGGNGANGSNQYGGGGGGGSAGMLNDGNSGSGSTGGAAVLGGGTGGNGGNNGSGSPGTEPGGGGGGGEQYQGGQSYGGAGAVGRVIITYACQCTLGIWDGSTSTSWDEPTNWSCDIKPNASTNVIIPDVANDPVISSTTAACSNLTIESGAVLTIGAGGALTVGGTITNNAGASGLVIKSISQGATGTGSLITSSSVAATVERYMSEDVWHIVSSPVSNQSISGFLTNTGNPITSYGDPYNNYDMIQYNENSDDWSDYFTATTPGGNMGIAKGYSVVPLNNAAAHFSGTLNAGSPTISITRVNQGWNCIGNPYPTAISVNSFFTDNSNANGNLIDNNYKALYLWDEGAGYSGTTFEYIALSNATVNLPWIGDKIAQTQVALGQGFIIRKATSGSANITFTPSMKVIPTDAVFKNAVIPWPAMQLFVSPKNGDLKSSTIVAINDQMTKGLDPGYDVGMLKANPKFALYTRLVEGDKGVDFTTQCLPVSADYEQNPYRIPVGLDFEEGGEITFTARFAGLPQGTPVYLEDKLLQKTVNIAQEGAGYSTIVAAGTKGIGRFYLHGSSQLVTSINQLPVNEYLVYIIGKAIVVNGDFSPDTRLVLFSVDGRILYDGKAGSINQCHIDANHLPSGVYLLSITDNGQRQTKKIVLGQN